MCQLPGLGRNDRYSSAVGVAGIISLRQQKDAAFAKRPLDTGALVLRGGTIVTLPQWVSRGSFLFGSKKTLPSRNDPLTPVGSC